MHVQKLQYIIIRAVISYEDDVIRDSLSSTTTTKAATIDKKLKTINPATEEVLNGYTTISRAFLEVQYRS